MKLLNLILTIILFSLTAMGKAKIQNEDIKSAADLLASGGTISSLINDDKIYVKANGLNIRLLEAIESGVLSTELPSGSILTFAGQICPPGYLTADGASYLRSLYPNLFTAIGTAHGFMSPTTFNVPDYRGRFLRGVTGMVNRDPNSALRQAMALGGSTGNSVGSVQGHSFQAHNHLQNPHQHVSAPGVGVWNTVRPWSPGISNFVYVNGNFQFGGGGSFANLGTSLTNDGGFNTTLQTATNQTAIATGGLSEPTSDESRPLNAYVNYCIKF